MTPNLLVYSELVFLLTFLIPRHLTEGIKGCQAYLNDWPTYFGMDF
jgi:hypothetical protein